VPAVVAERAVLGPGPDQHVEVLVGAVVALVLVEPVAVAALLDVTAAADHVHRHPAAGEVVQGGEAPGRQRGRDEPRPVRDQESEPLTVRRRVGRDLQPIRSARTVPDQHLVEAGLLRAHGVNARTKSRSISGPTPGWISETCWVPIIR